MKKLTRILLINWHSYSYQYIPVKMISFLTGKTAAGKSTIIDALQLVMLADTQGSSFNKAASQKSARTLKGYLYGEQGDDGDTGSRFIRSGGSFTSYVVLEFYDDTSGRYLTSGFAADCFSDLNFTSRWFILYSSAIPENGFLSDGHPLTLDKLKAQFKKAYPQGSYEFFETNKSYHNAFLSRLGVDEQYASLLRKAVPFTPISNITRFITESICETDNTIDVEEMSADIRSYRILEDEATLMNKKVAELEKIAAAYEEIERNRERLKEAEYILARAVLDDIAAEIEQLSADLATLEADRTCTEAEIESEHIAEERLSLEKDELQKQYYSSGEYTAKARLEERLKELKVRLSAIRSGIGRVVSAVSATAARWLSATEYGLFVSNEDRNLLLQASKTGSESIASISLRRYSSLTISLYKALSEELALLSAERNRLTSLIDAKQQLVRSLENGIKPYPKDTASFMAEFEKASGERPLVFADLVEVEDEAWRSALESYLGQDRFTLIVSPQNLDKAVHMAEKYDSVRIFDSGAPAPEVLPSSALSALRIEESASNLAAILLGSVSLAQDMEALPDGAWIATSGLSYRNGEFIRDIAHDAFLGREAAIIMLEAEKRALASLQASLEETKARHRLLSSSATSSDIINEQSASDYQTAIDAAAELPSIKQELEETEMHLSSLDLDLIARLEKAIADTDIKITASRARQSELVKKQGELNAMISQLKNDKLPAAKAEFERKDADITAAYSASWITAVGADKYAEAKNRERAALTFRETYETQAKRCNTVIVRDFNKLVELRTKYNASHLVSYNVEAEDNKDYSDELVRLKENQLPMYGEKIADAKERAFRQFRENFISRIKSNIEKIERTIRVLNRTLSDFRFGTDSYRFVVGPNKDYIHYYQMFTDDMLMQNTDNLFASSFEEKYRSEIADLFSTLVYDKNKASAEDQREHEKKIALYTDYRTYLVFDLCVTDSDGNTQRLSKTLLTKSGGETQLPFYIGLLASFSQVCKIRSKVQNNTVRLIILDEAFSKMDGERIKESIRLLKDFGLQAIFSAPPEKLSDIAPLVDETIIVYKEHGVSSAEEYSLDEC